MLNPSLWNAALRHGWDVERLASWRVPEELREVSDPVLYLEGLFGPMLAAEFGLRLLEPPLDWLPGLPEESRKRTASLMSLRQARMLNGPAFIKPPNDKSFPALVYHGAESPREYDDDSPVLVAEVVTWEKEFRCFVLDRELRAFSIYLRNGELQKATGYSHTQSEESEAFRFLKALLDDSRVDLPRATVIDVGVIRDRGWAVVEQNSAWGSGLYGCDPERVLEVLRFASVPC